MHELKGRNMHFRNLPLGGEFMLRKRKYAAILLILLTAFLLFGCSKEKTKQVKGTTCTVYLEELPQEYDQLAQSIRDDIVISVSLRNVSSDKRFTCDLTEKNNFRQVLDLIPGTYKIESVYLTDANLAMFEVDTELKSVKIEKNVPFDLPVLIQNADEFINTMTLNKPSEDIIKADLYSRKIQYNGQMIDLNNIQSNMTFAATSKKKLSHAETMYIGSTSHPGVSLIVQNQTDQNIPADQATVVGVYFFKNNVVLPQGITLGTEIRAIAHAKEGLLGTPNYCTGSPLMRLGLDKTVLVYIDEDSGDRISFYVDPGDSFISGITYEFEKYE